MATPTPPRGNADPKDELGSELREAVEAVLHDDPPTDWARETLESLRRRSLRTAPRQSHRFVRWLILAVAASILVLFLSIRTRFADHVPEVVDRSSQHPKESPVFVQSDAVRPTLWVYQRAARQSLETLDTLLDEHAGKLLQPTSKADLVTQWQELL